MDFSVFDAFPNGIIYGVWEIGCFQHGTVVGNEYKRIRGIDVVVDEGSSSSISSTPETLASDLLLYVKPEQMPTLHTNRLVSAYMLYNRQEDAYYEIIDAGVGKNQHTGEIEHLELKVVQTEVVDGKRC